MREEASGEPKKGAVAVTRLPYGRAAVGLRKELDEDGEGEADAAAGILEDWLVKHF